MRPASDVLVKPRLRGVSHEVTFYLTAVACAVLIPLAPAGVATLAAAIYGASVVTLFGTSALYHRPNWSPQARNLMRRLDHAAIFVLIAGSYTPICLVAMPPERGWFLAALVWGSSLVGILRAIFWPHAPRWFTAATYIAVGWMLAFEWSAVGEGLGPTRLGLILAGGVLYSLGALVYARRWPNPAPEVFGYHEIFHALVVAAALCHFAALGSVIAAGAA